ncbi:hypothetical protein AYL99_06053 [Fonsecaea erecta]|uniref:HNH nuclease domain-containing protein n=1 Tax=Fonsecaea erecta TaxID=1367422 RepID=A0A178ZMM1_9EURO|nr:hypothetical protein AYL99_06053 [Fonsecaea erecta]OAP61049.1 hypothetical protein AYL99_06053 [Fonsecaea erecta]
MARDVTKENQSDANTQQDYPAALSMSDYAVSTATDKMKHANNIIRLRSDIHTVFDAKEFAIVPIGGRLVAYCLNTQPGSHVARLYHGVELHPLGNAPELLFARFAYTVFENLRAFLDGCTERKLCIRTGNTRATEICDSEKCQQFSRVTASQGKYRSASPEEMETDDVDWSDEELSRGRKRRQSTDSDGDCSSYLSEDQWVETPSHPRYAFRQKTETVVLHAQGDISNPIDRRWS